MGALSAPSTGSSFGNISGIFPGGTSGAGISNDCLAYSGAGMQTGVNGGHYGVVRGDNVYLGMIYQGLTLTHDPSNPTNPRIDLIVLRVRDPGVDANVTQSARVEIIKGDPAAVPTEPTTQLVDGDFVISAVTVRANTTSTVAGDYADRRRWITARGGTTPYDPNVYTPVGAYEGQLFFNIKTDAIEVWNGTALAPVAAAAAWTQFTPKLYSSAGECDLGSGATARAAFQVLGKTMRVRYYFLAKRPCNLGYGTVYTRLPQGYIAAATEGGIGAGTGRALLNTQPPGGTFLQWPGYATLFENDNKIYPNFPLSRTDTTGGAYRVATSAGAAGTGIPLLAAEYPDPLRGLAIDVELEVQ